MTPKEPTTNVIGSILLEKDANKSLFRKKDPTAKAIGSFLAEKEGFEPSIPFWGIHDFQSCALGQLRDFSMSAQASLSILHHPSSFVKSKLFFFQHFLEAPENGGFQKIILQTGFRKARCKSLFDSTIPHVFPAPQYDRPASQESHPLPE